MPSNFLALLQAQADLWQAQYRQPVTYIPKYEPANTQTLYAEITIEENLAPRGDHKGSFIPVQAMLKLDQGAFVVGDQFQFVNPATGILTTWIVIGSPRVYLDGTQDLMVKDIVTIEKSGEGWRGNR